MKLPKLNSAKFNYENSFKSNFISNDVINRNTTPISFIKDWKPIGYNRDYLKKDYCIAVMFEDTATFEHFWCHIVESTFELMGIELD